MITEPKEQVDNGYWKCDGCGSDGRSCGCSEYWNDIKDYYKDKQNKYEEKISPTLSKLYHHPECKEVGDHYRIGGVWDFWHTGTVRNIKTGQNISINQLVKMFPNYN